MAKQDEIVSHIYSSYDYDKFIVIPQNRGRQETNGIKPRKLVTLAELHDNDEYFEEWARVKVNESFIVLDGAHTLADRKARKLPIFYEIIKGERFNNGHTKRQLMGAIFLANKNSTAWTGDDFFRANLQLKAPLAVLMNETIEHHGNMFKWTDLLALLTKDEDFFTGRFKRSKADVFEDRKLIAHYKSNEFQLELKFFVKLNAKAMGAWRKSNLLKAAYLIINKARTVVDPKAFRRYVADIPIELIQKRENMLTVEAAIKACIKYINSCNGKSYKESTVMFEIKNQISKMKNTKVSQEEDEAEPILEIN